MGLGKKYRFGSFDVKTGSRELFKSGMRIRLRGQPYVILELLLDRAGEVVTREEIREKLWPGNTFVDFEHGLNTSVKKLRQVLCDSADEPRYIETVPRLGYRFVAPVEVENGTISSPVGVRSFEPIPSPLLDRRVESQPKQTTTSDWALLRFGLAGGLLLAAVFAVVVARSAGRMPFLFGSSRVAVNAAVAPRHFNSIAVLPLQNLSNDPSHEYFTDGMTDELITDLAQLKLLRVISRTSVMHYKGTKQTVPQIGRELGVDAIVEGSVEQSGDRIRIRVQLIDAAADRHLWARSYDHEIKDLLALESTAAHDIAAEIQGQLAAPNANSHSVNDRPVRPEAYEAYLKGRYFWNQRSEQGLKRSIEYYQDAIAKDPTFAAAYAGMAGSYSVLGSDDLPPEIARKKAREAASKALELDPNIAEGHAQMGLVAFYYEWNWKQAEQEFRRAIDLNPSYAPAHQWYSYYLRAMGRLQEALDQAKQAQQLDPLSLPIASTLAGRYRDLGQYDQAIAVVQKVMELNPDFGLAHEVLGSVYEREGNFKASVAEWQRAAELSQNNPSVLAALGHVYGLSGNTAEARKTAERLKPMSERHYVAAWDVAVLYAGMRDSDSAFRWLEKAYRDRDSQMPFLKQDHRLAPLQSDPRFQNLLRRVGLPT